MSKKHLTGMTTIVGTPEKVEYNCFLDLDGDHYTWKGYWSLLSFSGEPGHRTAELDVVARHSQFYAVFGECTYGHYLSIPNWDAGCALSGSLTDWFWNYERLTKHLRPVDAASVVYAIRDFAMKSGWIDYDNSRLYAYLGLHKRHKSSSEDLGMQ